MRRLTITMFLVFGLQLISFGQETETVKELPQDWHHLDLTKDEMIGVSSHLTYKKLIKRKKGKSVIVAVIDSGIDIEHEDLKDVLWVNKGEIAGNGIDDDGNGYIDDVHGWSFIGGPEGDVHQDNLEITRLVRKYQEMFEDADTTALQGEMRSKYKYYLNLKAEYTTEYANYSMQADFYGAILESFKKIKNMMEEEGGKSVEELELSDPREQMIANMIGKAQAEGVNANDMLEEIQEAVDYFRNRVDFMLNLDFDPRDIVGDNYDDHNERFYGNNQVTGPDAMHGTHVAGIIAAVRNNDIGMDGIANNVEIMVVRAVPDGDERDKDVANAIRYAVDNGASIINMSFGKAYSWNKTVVDEAITYAIDNDVLLVHAAGNEGKNTDVKDNFPNNEVIKSESLADAWIEVGASTYMANEKLPAPFSNYGKNKVDIFAPGQSIYSTLPDNDYKELDGTSMAAPVVAGIAAVIRSYYPLYSAEDVKSIIIRSATTMETEVNKPGSKEDKIAFGELSQSGAVANLYNAMQLAKKEYRQKKKSLKKKS